LAVAGGQASPDLEIGNKHDGDASADQNDIHTEKIPNIKEIAPAKALISHNRRPF
jgi:hypothetical protein